MESNGSIRSLVKKATAAQDILSIKAFVIINTQWNGKHLIDGGVIEIPEQRQERLTVKIKKIHKTHKK